MRFLCFAFLILSYSLYSNEIAFNDLPENARESIESLFNYFGRLGNLGHVLFFDKFPHPNFIICEEMTEVAGGEYLNIYFINKKALSKCLDKNLEAFIEVLGENFSPEAFIAELENRKVVSPLILHDEMLKGILLGFGKTSSLAFKNRGSSQLFPISGKPKTDKKFGIATVSFMTSDPECDEVKQLKIVYTTELLKIAELFEKGLFAKRALQILCHSKK